MEVFARLFQKAAGRAEPDEGSTMNQKTRLVLYSMAHCAVDFSCAFLLFRLCRGEPDWALWLLLYNFCAFALQMPLGALADRLNRNGVLAAGGCGLIALCPLLPRGTAMAVTAGVGNALFHIGGGLDTLNDSKSRAAALGIFVSPGALGLSLGMLCGQGKALPLWVPSMVLAGLAGGILALCRGSFGSLRSENAEASLVPAGEGVRLVPLFLVVVLRSYMGMQQSFPWRQQWAMALTVMLVLGKASGGFLSDRLGARRASALSLGGAAGLYLLCMLPGPGLLAVLLFNMTMPITLWAAARLLPGAKGFVFGLMTFALFLGFLPSYLGWPSLLTGPGAYAVVTVISLVLLRTGLGREAP